MADGSIVIDTKVDLTGLSALSSAADTAMKGVTVALSAVTGLASTAAGYMIKVGSDFEAGMSKVQAISGASGKDMEALTQKAQEMGATTKFSATEAASAMEYMAMAGWKTEDMLNGIGGIMNLAAASGESLALTSDIVTDALTAFGLTAADSGRFADVLAAASSNANTNVAMMGETFKYVAPVAGALGYSAEDTAVAIGLMANAGIKASQAGTSLRGFLTNLAKPTGTIKDYMDDLEISLTDVNGEIKPLNQLLGELRERFSELTEAEKAKAAAGLAGKEAMSGLLAIVNASNADFQKLTDAIANSNGAAAKMAETMQNNLQGSLTILESTVEGLGISFYDNIKISATEAVKSLIGTLSSHSFKSSFDNFSKSSAKMIDQLADLSEKALPLAVDGFAFLAENLRDIIGVTGGVYLGFKTFSIIGTFSGMIKSATTALSAYSMAGSVVTVQQAALNGSLTLGQIAVGVLTGQIGLATAAQGAWNIVMAANPVGLIVAGVGALTVGLAAYFALTKDSTSATQELCDEADELVQSSQEMRDALEGSAQQRQKEREAMEAEAGAAKVLADRLYNLADKTNKTAGEKQEMLSLVDQLNQAIPGLNLAYDAENDRLSKQREEVDGLIDANLELLKAKAAQEDRIKIAEEIYQTEKKRNDLMQERKKIQEDLTQREAELKAAIEDTSNAYAVTDLMAAHKFNTEDLRKQVANIDAEIVNIEGDISSMNGEFDRCGEYIKNTAESAENAAENMEDMGEAGAEAGEKIGQSAASMAEDLGASEEAVEKLQKRFEGYLETATDIFSKIGEASEHGIDEMIANLEANQKAMNEWADNLVLAAERGVDQGLLLTLQEAGPEAGGYVRNIVDASDMEISRLNEVFRNGAEAARKASNAELTLLKSDSIQLVRETVDGMEGKMRDGAPDVGDAAGNVRDAALGELAPMEAGFREAGEQAAEGMRSGLVEKLSDVIRSVRESITSIVGAARLKLEVNSPSKLTMREIGMPFMEGIGKGFEKSLPEVEGRMRVSLDDMVGKMETAVAAESSVIGMNTAARQYSTSTSSTVNLGGIKNHIDYYGGGSPADADGLMRRMAQKTQQSLRARGVRM